MQEVVDNILGGNSAIKMYKLIHLFTDTERNIKMTRQTKIFLQSDSP